MTPSAPAAPAVIPPAAPGRDATADRLRHYLKRMADSCPGLWKSVDKLRALQGKEGMSWPSWCFMPLAGSYAILSEGREMAVRDLPVIGSLGALAAWRVSQGIYRYDSTVLDAVWETPITGDIPENVLMALPEWCVYVETPGRRYLDNAMEGFFAYLEYDVKTDRRELRLVADDGISKLESCMPIHLGSGGLLEGMQSAIAEAQKHVKRRGLEVSAEMLDRMSMEPARAMESIMPMVSTVLYLCAANAEIRSERAPRPIRPLSVKTKEGPRMFPPEKPVVWEVGYRIGATIRGAMARAEEEKRRRVLGGTHASPIPHKRRFHWHRFWVGEKAKPGKGPVSRQLILHWLPLTWVNLPDDAEENLIVPTIHRVI